MLKIPLVLTLGFGKFEFVSAPLVQLDWLRILLAEYFKISYCRTKAICKRSGPGIQCLGFQIYKRLIK